MTTPLAVFLEITVATTNRRRMIGTSHIVAVDPLPPAAERQSEPVVGLAYIDLDDGRGFATVESYDDIRRALHGGIGTYVHG